jgi:nickel superoxide dismutase
MLKKLFHILDRMVPSQIAYAHCDVPCGLYTPDAALLAADTVVKMTEKILALGEGNLSREDAHALVRATWTKEEHARKCKEELLILWTDFFKPEHLTAFPDLHETFWKAAKLCSKVKQSVDLEAARELRAAVEKIASMLAQAKAKK